MSDHLVSNGRNLYKRSGHLVRQPVYKTVTVPLLPDQKSWYSIANEYYQGFPSRGFVSPIDALVNEDCVLVGKEMRKRYLGRTVPSSGVQMWRDSSNRDPQFVFYQGFHAPSGPRSFYQAEAYMQIPAYHFSLPSQYNGMDVVGSSLSLIHGGTILNRGGIIETTVEQYRPYYASSAPTNLLDQNSDWRNGWEQKFGLYENLKDAPYVMHENATDSIVLRTDLDPGDLVYSRNNERYYAPDKSKLWEFTNISFYYEDGYIPITWHPWTQSANLSAGFCAKLNSWRGGWVVGTPNVSISTLYDQDNDLDYPCSTIMPPSGHRWLCCSYWGFQLTVNLRKKI